MTISPSDSTRPSPTAGVPETESPTTRSRARKAALAGAVGTVIEFYDFSLYGLLAVVFAPLYFPAHDRAGSTLVALGALGTAYLARPVGGVFFGRLGDRYGRRPVLMATVTMMGVAAGATGLLPSYSTLGVAAPILLMVLRLVQGFSAGGELAGATTYAVESAPEGRRTFFGAIVSSGGSVGFVAAALAAGLIGLMLTPEQFSAWGWRVPFLLCIPLAVVCLLLRARIDESPEFAELRTRAGVSRSPIREVLREYPGALARVIGIQIAASAAGYVGLVYLSVYLIGTRNFPAEQVYWVSAVAISVEVVTLPYFGILAGRVGRRKVLLGATAAFLVLAYPFFMAFSATDSIVVVALIYCALMLVDSAQKAPLITEYTLMFPVRYRYTGTALGYNIATALAGGFGPYIAAQLIILTGSTLAPAYWLMATSALGVSVLLSMRPREGKS